MKEVGYNHYISHTSDSLAIALGLLPKMHFLTSSSSPLLHLGSCPHMRKPSESSMVLKNI